MLIDINVCFRELNADRRPIYRQRVGKMFCENEFYDNSAMFFT